MAFLQPQEPPAKWFFFCESYLHLLDWEKRLGGLASRIPTSSTISEAAHQLRKPFLDLITAQGRVHASIAWWTSRVSERNTRVSPLFLNCCYLRAGQMALQNQEGRLCVIAESWAVMESLADTAARYGWSVEWVTRKNRVAEYLRFSFETAKRVTAFLEEHCSRCFATSQRDRLIGHTYCSAPGQMKPVSGRMASSATGTSRAYVSGLRPAATRLPPSRYYSI